MAQAVADELRQAGLRIGITEMRPGLWALVAHEVGPVTVEGITVDAARFIAESCARRGVEYAGNETTAEPSNDGAARRPTVLPLRPSSR